MDAWRKSHRAPSRESQILTSGARLNKHAAGALRNEPNGIRPQAAQSRTLERAAGGLRNEPNGRWRFKLQISNPKSEWGRRGRELRRCRLRIAKRTQRALALQAPNLKSQIRMGRVGRELRRCRLRFAKRTQRALAPQAPNLKSEIRKGRGGRELRLCRLRFAKRTQPSDYRERHRWRGRRFLGLVQTWTDLGRGATNRGSVARSLVALFTTSRPVN
jgi:hypothetical protein